VNRNDVILGIAAALLVAFALVVSIVIPRKRPNFPAKHLGLLLLIGALLIVGMLTAVEVLGESHHFEAAGEGAGSPTEQAATVSTTAATTTAPASTGATTTQAAPTTGGAGGDATAGKQVFTATAQPPCGSCHTLAEAGASGQVGPNLDDVLKGKDAAFIHESIVDPNAEIASGFSAGVMPDVYGQQLSDAQLADLVAFLQQAAS
jgi:mono/diheme cytochrome c family protein